MKKVLTVLLAGALLTPGLAAAHGPSRLKVDKKIEVNAPPAKVWAIIGDFCSIAKWHPAVATAKCDGPNKPGTTRLLHLGKADGPTIKEQLKIYNPKKMTYKYIILDVDVHTLPVQTYHSHLTVSPGPNGGSIVDWRGSFYRGDERGDPPPDLNDAAAVKGVTSVYEAGLENIKKIAEGGK